MPLESSIVGSTGPPMVSEIDSRWTMAYAAALGDAMPCYMDTIRGVIAHPMFPVCFEWPVQVAMRAQFEKSTSLTRDEAMRAVHATYDTVLYLTIRPHERLTTQLTVAGVERRRPGAYMVTRLDTVDEAGKPVCTSWYGAIYRGVEVIGSDAPAKIAPAPTQPIIEEGEPLSECQVDVPAGMAHIYTECARVFNPIHTDAAVGARGRVARDHPARNRDARDGGVANNRERGGQGSGARRAGGGTFRRDGDDAVDADRAHAHARGRGRILRGAERRRPPRNSRRHGRAARVTSSIASPVVGRGRRSSSSGGRGTKFAEDSGC